MRERWDFGGFMGLLGMAGGFEFWARFSPFLDLFFPQNYLFDFEYQIFYSIFVLCFSFWRQNGFAEFLTLKSDLVLAVLSFEFGVSE